MNKMKMKMNLISKNISLMMMSHGMKIIKILKENSKKIISMMMKVGMKIKIS